MSNKKQNHIAIEVKNVVKSFKIPLDGGTSLKQKIVHFLKREKGYRNFTPLNDVSFTVNKGEFFGIVGRNGSGKSTLLKTIAGIYTPDGGYVKVNGTLVPFIELGVGFNPELTGRENVFLNGALLGFSRKEMEAMYEEIVDFAELHEFMDERLKNYSSGMQVRLAFSIAIRAKGDILLLDEVLAVGDEAFQRKCYEYFAQLKSEGRTVILVTHSMEAVQRFCSKAMLINDGKVAFVGEPIDVAEEYSILNRPASERGGDNKDKVEKRNEILKKCTIEVRGDISNTSDIISHQDRFIYLKSVVILKKRVKDVFFGLTIRKQSGELVYWYTTESPHEDVPDISENKPLVAEFKIQNIFGEGQYEVGIHIKSKDRTKDYVRHDKAHSFRIGKRGVNGFMLHPDVEVKISQ